VFLGTTPLEALYSGPAGEFPGLWQINARVPSSRAVSGQTPLFVGAEGFVSNGATVWVER